MQCPYCPKVVNSSDTEARPPDFVLGQHIFQSPDHPDISYAEARTRVIEYNEGTDTETEGSENPADDTVPFGETGSLAGSTKYVETSPVSSAPLVTDGGEEEEEEPEAEEEGEGGSGESVGSDDCPKCSISMIELREGKVIQGADGNTYKTDGSEKRCPSCGLVKDGDKYL